MKQSISTLYFLWFLQFSIAGQGSNFIGSGNNDGISVTSSSELLDTAWTLAARAISTIDGSGMDADYFDAARFLMQASVGFEDRHVEEVLNVGIENWIDQQLSMPPSLMLPKISEIYNIRKNDFIAAGGNASDFRPRPFSRDFNYAWWDINMTNDDLLKHKVAAAYSEIFVVSRLGQLEDIGYGLASYYDIFLEEGFGNFRELIERITYHSCMGVYLTYIFNPKTDTIAGIRPDENYAREIMQLFTIGLSELNIDGSKKLLNGQEIPTYNQNDIRELAKVFTGLGYGANFNPAEGINFNMSVFAGDHTVPMIIWDTDDPSTSINEDQHEEGEKILFGTEIIPSGQSGAEDISDALDILFAHENVGPFISRLLIQRLIKSNPSPDYIERVATKFNNNGAGVRGDMKAVIKAIYMDEEARLCDYQMDDHNSRLKEPLFRYTHFARMVAKTPSEGPRWNANFEFYERVRQDILSAPSVFNFFLPNSAPNGPIGDAGLVAPEFSLHDERTSIQYINRVELWARYARLIDPLDENYPVVFWDKAQYEQYINDTERYLNWLDKQMCHGTMSDRTRRIIRTALDSYDRTNSNQELSDHRILNGMFLALISPEYNVIK